MTTWEALVTIAGLVLNLRPADMVDFLLGWTTYDFMGDDFYAQAAAAAAAKEAPAAAEPAPAPKAEK